MTTRELRNDVSALCFCDIGERDGRFITYANLALRAVYKELDILATHTINTSRDRLCSYTSKILHKGGETESAVLEGKAYSFFAVGKGTVSIEDGKETAVKSFDTEGTAFRGFLHSGGRLILSGEYSFTVFSLAAFKEITSENEADIPLIEALGRYDMRKLVKDFQSFCLMPRDVYGNEIKGASFFDGILSVPDYSGESISVTYRRLPRRIYIDDPNAEIDLPEEYSELLVTLCAYFMCLDDDKESAEYYKDIYNTMLTSHKKSSRERFGTEKVLTNGWA